MIKLLHPAAFYDRPLHSVFVPDFAALREMKLPSPCTVMLIVADATNVATDVIARVAEKFLDAGLVSICAWGPDCERVHDLFDEMYVGDGSVKRDLFMMSTWHHEALEDAVEFFAFSAVPVEVELECVSCIAVVVGNTEWAAGVERVLGDLLGLESERAN